MKSIKFQRDMLKFCDFIQVYVFTTNHHLKAIEWQKRGGKQNIRKGKEKYILPIIKAKRLQQVFRIGLYFQTEVDVQYIACLKKCHSYSKHSV